MTYIYPIVLYLFIAICIVKIPFFNGTFHSKATPVGLFSLKVFFGFALYLYYSMYSGNQYENFDIFKFFNDGKELANLYSSNPWEFIKIMFGFYDTQSNESIALLNNLNHWYKPYNYGAFNDNQTIIRLNALIHLFSFNNIYIHIIVINLLSFTGLIFLYRLFLRLFEIDNRLLIMITFFIPGVLFWGSGLLKEGILLFALGYFLYQFFEIVDKKTNITGIIKIIVGLLLMLSIKNYVLMSLIPSLIIYVVYKNSRIHFYKISLLVILSIISLITLNHYLKIGPDIFEYIYLKQRDFINVALLNNSGSYFESFVLEPSFFSILFNSPMAFINSFFRPYLFDINSFTTLFAFLENVLIYILIILCVLFFKKPNNKLQKLIFIFGVFILIMYVLIGLTTPVSGAIVRYKVPILPFLFILLLSITDFEKIKMKFKIGAF